MSTDRPLKITDKEFQAMMQLMDKEDPKGEKAMARLRKAAVRSKKKEEPKMKAAATEHFIVIGPGPSSEEAMLFDRDALLQLLTADAAAPKMQVKIANHLCAKSVAVKIGVDWCEASSSEAGPGKYWILELSLAGRHKYQTLIGSKESSDCGIHIPASFLAVLGRYVISGHNMSVDEPREVIDKEDIQSAYAAVEARRKQQEAQAKDIGESRSPSPNANKS